MIPNITKYIERLTAGAKVAAGRASDSKKTDNARRAFLGKSATAALTGVSTIALISALTGKAKADVTDSGLSDDLVTLRSYFRQIQKHEQTHTNTLKTMLGANARPEPTFHNLVQDTMDDFIAMSQAFENVGAAAYFSSSPYIATQAHLAAAASIGLIEGRQAGFLNFIQGDPLTGHAFALSDDENLEKAYTPAKLASAATPFVRSLNGGPALTFAGTRSAANDIMIMNFALAQEYLELTFYNQNIHRFFGYQS